MTALDPRTRSKLETLRGVGDRIHHVHAMVERFAATLDPAEADTHASSLKREMGRFKQDLSTQGFDLLAQKAGDIQILAGRRGSHSSKRRMLREAVGSLRSLVDLEKRRVTSAAKRADRASEAALENDQPDE